MEYAGVLILLMIGVIFLLGMAFFIGETFRRRLKEKEEELLELYQSIEELMEEFERMVQESKDDLVRQRQELEDRLDGLKKEEKPLLSNSAGALQNKEIPKASSPPPTKRERVEDLHRKGLGIAEIARELKLGQGEVRLILDMYGDKV
ncbi:MAG: DUF6115 domain-containing protein [Clostridia bacterium]|jgi:DNA-binding NarL/FixJ family response regulator